MRCYEAVRVIFGLPPESGQAPVDVSKVPKPHVSAGAGGVWPGDPPAVKRAARYVATGRRAARNALSRAEAALEPTNSRQRQDPLEDRRQADQHHEQFEKACQTAILDKLIDGPKQIAPMTQIIRIPIKATSIAKPPRAGVVTALGRQHP